MPRAIVTLPQTRLVKATLLPATLIVATLLFSAIAASAQVPSDDLFSDFRPSGEFLIEVNGQKLADAELYKAERAGAYLILAPSLPSPLLVNARSRQVERISLLKVSKQSDGSIDLLADASFDTVGAFDIGDKRLSFLVDDKAFVLKEKPSLLGEQTPASLYEYDPSYKTAAGDYAIDAAIVEGLRTEKRDVEVQIYYGSWCPVCSRLVPKVLRLEEELGDSKIRFQYYGLPRDMDSDPVTEKKDLHGVPTGVVMVDGKEVGRMGGRELYKPEASLKKLLAGG